VQLRPNHAPHAQRPDWVQARIMSAPASPPRVVAQPKLAASAVRPTPNGTSVQLPGDLDREIGGGVPLPAAVRQKMEAAFGANFADVRVHVDARAASIGAVAFTRGSHIHFAPAQYNPSTLRGQHLLAHELAHVVQQRTGRVRNPFGAGVAVVQDTLLEAEAERMAGRATAGIVQRASPNPYKYDNSAWEKKGKGKKGNNNNNNNDPHTEITRLWEAIREAATPYLKIAKKMEKNVGPLMLDADEFEKLKAGAAGLNEILKSGHVAYPGNILEPVEDAEKYGVVYDLTVNATPALLDAILVILGGDDAGALVASGLIDIFIKPMKLSCITTCGKEIYDALTKGRVGKRK